MTDLVEQINEARKVVEELGGKPTKGLDDLKGELDRMIEASRQPGYSLNNMRVLQQKRALVVDVMKTAAYIVIKNALDETTAETMPPSSEASAQSAFAPAADAAKPPLHTDAPAETPWQKFLSGTSSVASQGFEGFKGFVNSAGTHISEFFAYLGTSITTLWNSWFGKKDTSAATPDTETQAQSTPVADPEAQRKYEQDPPASTKQNDEAKTAVLPNTATTTKTPTLDRPAEPDPLTADTNPAESGSAEAAPVTAINLMDKQTHEIGDHQFSWQGEASNLFSVNGKKFGVSTVTHLVVTRALTSIKKQGELLIIETSAGNLELNKNQVDAMMNHIQSGTPTTKSKLFGGSYKSLSVTIDYTKVADGTRTPGSRQIELLPE